MKDNQAYVECRVCHRQLLVECHFEINSYWQYDPEDLPDGWNYTIEPYPSTKNYIYCPEHKLNSSERMT